MWWIECIFFICILVEFLFHWISHSLVSISWQIKSITGGRRDIDIVIAAIILICWKYWIEKDMYTLWWVVKGINNLGTFLIYFLKYKYEVKKKKIDFIERENHKKRRGKEEKEWEIRDQKWKLEIIICNVRSWCFYAWVY